MLQEIPDLFSYHRYSSMQLHGSPGGTLLLITYYNCILGGVLLYVYAKF